MTDKEIERAIELCASENLLCDGCVYLAVSCQGHNCRNALIHDLQDYINRLKEEKAQVRKDTAKEILVKWWKENIATDNEYGNDYVDELVLDYGLDYGDFRTSIEVDDE